MGTPFKLRESARDIAERAHDGAPVAQSDTDSLAVILADRRKTHGKWKDHASFTQTMKGFHRQYQMQPLSDMQRESLDMIFHKIGRIMAGNPNVADHWADIAGYARLVANELEGGVQC